MGDNSNAVIMLEMSQSAVAMVELTNVGDNKEFLSDDEYWSSQEGFEPDVKPDGLETGGAVIPGAAVDTVSVAALTCYLVGVKTTVGADAAVSVPRPTVSDYKVCAVTITSGGAIAVIEGAEGTSFSEDRGEDGGPPYIPVGSITLRNVSYSSQTPAKVDVSEIKEILGVTLERYDFPTWDEKRMNITEGIVGDAGVMFHGALSLIHTGDLPKAVYAAYFTPEFAEIPSTKDFVPAEETHSQSSEAYYGRTIGSKASSLSQASFTVRLETGIRDAIIRKKNKLLFVKFLQNKLSTDAIMTQGYLGLSRTFVVDTNPIGTCTLTAEVASEEITG